MLNVETLLAVARCYSAAQDGIPMTTVSHRVFDDSKKIIAIERGGDITVGRFNAAMRWFAANWPAGAELPEALLPYVPPKAEEDAA